MALPILDGNQTATTLSTVVSAGAHIPAHTVVSLEAQAINDIQNGIWDGGTPPSSRGDGDANPTYGIGLAFGRNIDGTAIVSEATPLPISGTVTANLFSVPTHGVTIANSSVTVNGTFYQATQPVSLASLPSLAAGTAQIGSVTASISGTVPVSISSVTIGNSVTIGSLPKPTWTDYSGTVVTAGSAVTAINTTTRSYLLAQVTTGQMFLNIGAMATTFNSVYFSAGQGFAWETSVPQGAVSIISTVTGTNYVLKEG